MMLITPAVAFLPNKVLWGPRRTSTLSTIGRSLILLCIFDRYTPSTNNATEGSTPLLFEPLPKPLIKKAAFFED